MPQHDALTLWLLLPELELPSSESDPPREVVVNRASVTRTSVERCEEEKLTGFRVVDERATGRTFVPLAVVEVEELAGSRTFRLPLDLGHWAWLSGMARTIGMVKFPARMRFGFAARRHTANFVDLAPK